jgi:GT2 family glycosyltransferase
MDAQRWREQQRWTREQLRARRPGREVVARDEQSPRVSVIVVCWNSAGTLGRCLDQLFAQDYRDYEVIVVDDGSDDDTLAVAERRVAHGNLEIVRSRRNRGCPHARNLGLARARGELVAFVDADGFAAPDWLSEIVKAFAGDATVGGVASAVFYDHAPLVINGAGGMVNRQGWAADLSMNEPYERAQIASEALYPMGCGMALRRCALEDVGPFDGSMLNYYDDVDYGMRLWRAGYRVVVAPDAWIDHGGGARGGDSPRKRLLCERHRMRVALKHTPARALGSWALHEVSAFRQAPASARTRKLRALWWNALRLPGVIASRWYMRRSAPAPARLIDRSWGDGFPAGVPPLLSPRPEQAGPRVDMADARSEWQLSYGWFPTEQVDGRSYRWAGVQAAALVSLQAPAKRLRLDYAHVPVDIGGVDVRIRRLDSSQALATVWGARLAWQYIARSVENHPIALEAGDYEMVFAVGDGWLEPPLNTRSLSLALASMSFEESFELGDGGLDMASPAVEEQLVSGWFEAEGSAERSYRWATGHAAAVVRVAERASGARVSYCLPPAPIGGLKLTICALEGGEPVWSARIPWADADWHEQDFAMELAAGDYLVHFDADASWSNPKGEDLKLWPENRSLGFALSSLSFGSKASSPGGP